MRGGDVECVKVIAGRDHLGEFGVGVRIILKLILKK
jgi:hypothetical protein